MLLDQNNVSDTNIFDDKLFFYGDEVDLCLKLKKYDLDFKIYDDIIIMHSFGQSTFNSKKKRNLFNEFFITSTCLTVVFYTAWIGDAMLEYNLGWVTIMLTLFTTLINLLNLIYFSVKFVYDFVRR